MNTIDMIKMIKLSDIIRNPDTNVSDKLKACELLLKAHEENELKKLKKGKMATIEIPQNYNGIKIVMTKDSQIEVSIRKD